MEYKKWMKIEAHTENTEMFFDRELYEFFFNHGLNGLNGFFNYEPSARRSQFDELNSKFAASKKKIE